MQKLFDLLCFFAGFIVVGAIIAWVLSEAEE